MRVADDREDTSVGTPKPQNSFFRSGPLLMLYSIFGNSDGAPTLWNIAFYVPDGPLVFVNLLMTERVRKKTYMPS